MTHHTNLDRQSLPLSPCLPVWGTVFDFLVGLSDEALKKESSTEAKGDTISSILKVGLLFSSTRVLSCYL